MERMQGLPATGTLIRAMEDNRCGLCSLFARLPGAEGHDGPDGLWVMTNDPFAAVNTVHRAQFGPTNVDSAIEAAKARGRARGIHLMWFVGPSTRPSDLATSLEAHGFVHDEDIVGMAMDLSQLPDEVPMPSGFEISEAHDEQELKTWCTTMVAAFQMPKTAVETYFRWVLALSPKERSSVHFFIGRLDGRPVATHLLVLAAGVAGVHFLGTLPAARGRGIGSVMCHNTFLVGRTWGYGVGVTEVEEPALGTCHRLGLTDYYTVSTYIWSGQETSKGESKRSWRNALASTARRAGLG
jgi:GNAT superfamily N-acetyltransferase